MAEWHFTRPGDKEWPEGYWRSRVDIWIRDMVCLYKSELKPAGGDPPIPIENGQYFWGRVWLQYKNLSEFDEWVTVGFYCAVAGTFQYAFEHVILPKQTLWSPLIVHLWGTTLDTRGLAPGRKIDTRKVVYFEKHLLNFSKVDSFLIGSDGDADTYEIVGPPPTAFDIKAEAVYR